MISEKTQDTYDMSHTHLSLRPFSPQTSPIADQWLPESQRVVRPFESPDETRETHS